MGYNKEVRYGRPRIFWYGEAPGNRLLLEFSGMVWYGMGRLLLWAIDPCRAILLHHY